MCRWCLGRVSVMCNDCVVMSWWYVGDVSALCRWCFGVSVMGGDAAVMFSWWYCDVSVMNIDDIDDFQWVPKQKESLFDVSLLLGSYAGLIFLIKLWTCRNFHVHIKLFFQKLSPSIGYSNFHLPVDVDLWLPFKLGDAPSFHFQVAHWHDEVEGGAVALPGHNMSIQLKFVAPLKINIEPEVSGCFQWTCLQKYFQSKWDPSTKMKGPLKISNAFLEMAELLDDEIF